jgi:hypothetical protein
MPVLWRVFHEQSAQNLRDCPIGGSHMSMPKGFHLRKHCDLGRGTRPYCCSSARAVDEGGKDHSHHYRIRPSYMNRVVKLSAFYRAFSHAKSLQDQKDQCNSHVESIFILFKR